ncbi:MAG TPA: ABC transporter substrate-binding protein [Terriglobales bacterium]|nr:ABC transporter substrate-binding protein [Terriglobales bacterium]
MKRLLSRSAAASSLVLTLLLAGHASSRPRYGGTAHILLHDRVNSIDPAAEEDYPAARDRVASLVFESLTTIDQSGQVRPLLAASWSSDSTKRAWQFRLRLANFHDGSTFTAADVVAALNKNPFGWKVTASDRLTAGIESATPVPFMPEVLAQTQFAIVKRLGDGSLVGTGSYKLSQWQPGERATLTANEDYWGGRPYPDAVDFQMGASLRDQVLQRQLGPASLAEVPLDQVRALEQSNQNLSIMPPADLLVVLFLQPDSSAGSTARKAVDPRVREAFAYAVNRSAISNVILQKRGAPASGLLPQWLTGYEFLFPSRDNPDHARELRADTAALVIIPPISLAYDYADPAARLVAERIAVDAREIGLIVQPYGESHLYRDSRSTLHADAVLLRLPLSSPNPSAALSGFLEKLDAPPQSIASALSASRPEELFDIEQKALEDFRIVPIAHVPQAVWLSNSIHNWQQLPTGAWDLDQLWVEGAR